MSSNLLSFAFGQNCDRSMVDKNILWEIYRPSVLWCVTFMQMVCICILRNCDSCIPSSLFLSLAHIMKPIISVSFFYSYINKEKGQSGVVNFATRHGMDDLEFDSR